LQGKTHGAEITAQYQLRPWWRVTSWYSNLQKQLELEPGSTDRTGGLQEGSGPRRQLFFRSSTDLPRRTALDVWVRFVSALEVPAPAPVPAYTVIDLRAGCHPVESFELSVTGRNLNQKHHLESGPFGELVGRFLYVTGAWRF
jgi:outer membrane receptor protein involved in Fe transport